MSVYSTKPNCGSRIRPTRYARSVTRLIDLSHPILDGMITYPGLPAPKISDYLTREDSRDHYEPGTEFSIRRIDMVANTGTYLDTPFHRFTDGFDLADLPLDRVADLPGRCVPVSGKEIGAETLDGLDVEGRAVLFATGWDRHWGTEQYGDSSHPFLSQSAAELLVTGGAALVGIDSVNIDDTRGRARPAHTTLLAASIPIVEHLTGLEALIDLPFRFWVLPAPVRGMGTFPVRAVAVV